MTATRTALGAVSAAAATTYADITLAADINAGDLVVVGVEAGNGSNFSASDGTNTYAVADHIGDGTTNATALLYKANAAFVAAGTTLRVSWTTGAWHAAWAAKWSAGASGGVLDKHTAAQGNSTAPNSGATADTTTATEIWVGCIGSELGGSTVTAPGGGFSLGQSGATGVTCTELYQTVAATGQATVSGTITSQHWGAVVATFTDGAGSVVGTATMAGGAVAGGAATTVRVVAGAARVALSVEVDWTGTGTWVDESARVEEATYRRGRAAVTDQFGAGQATLTLRNQDGRYSPYNSGSALYPNVVGGRPIRLTASYGGTPYPLWRGVTDELTQQPGLPATVELACVDAFDQFSRQTPTLGLVTSQRVDQVLTALLVAAGYAGATSFAVGRTLTRYAATQTTLLAELQTAVAQELGGALFVRADGALVFQNAGHRAAATVWTTVTGAERVELAVRQADLISRVDVAYGGYAVSGTAGAIATLPARQLAAAASMVLTGTWSTPGASDPVEPEAGTDYTAADILPADDLSGADPLDVTSQVAVWAWSTTAGGCSLTLHNLLPYPVLLSDVQVRGVAGVTAVTRPPSVSAAVASPLVTNVPLSLSALWQDDVTALTAFAAARRDALGSQHPRPVLTLVGADDATIVQILGAELSARVHVEDLAATWTTKLDGDFFIEQLEVTFRAGEPPEARWTLFDAVQGTPA